MGIGAAAGWLAAKWVSANAEGAPGWHARKGGAAARTMALTTAAAAGVPAAAGALLARQPPAATGAAHRVSASYPCPAHIPLANGAQLCVEKQGTYEVLVLVK